MIGRISLISLLFLALSQPVLAASKSDLAKEKRWEEQIVPSLLVGEAVELTADGTAFLGLYAENTTEKAVGGAIIVHGIGVHPAWPDIIDPVRMALPDAGWHTLSIQMPILKNEAEGKDYVPLMDEAPVRLQAAVAFLKAKGINNIVIIAHSLGTAMSGYYLAGKPDPAVHGYVAVSMPQFDFDKRFDNTAHMGAIKIPVLDIYGSQDLDTVLAGAKTRAAAAQKAGNKNFSQMKVEGANHFFTGMNEDIIKRVRGWLEKNVKGTENKK